jgi:hypothetical protein
MRYLCVNVKTISKVWMNFWGLHERISRLRWFNLISWGGGGGRALQRSYFYVNCTTIALNPKKRSMCLSLNVEKALKGVSYKWESFSSCENLNIDPGLVKRRPREKSLNKFHWNFEIVSMKLCMCYDLWLYVSTHNKGPKKSNKNRCPEP